MSNQYIIRSIAYEDYYKGFMDLINTFTKFPQNQSYDEFCTILDKIKNHNSHIYVIELDNKIVSTIKCIIEQKIHNNFKCVMHLEDIVTDRDYRRKGLATKLIQHCLDLAKDFNCYKIILCSNPENYQFYLNHGFIQKGTEFSRYL